MKNLIFSSMFLLSMACKPKQDCMSPPPKINFTILKAGINVSKNYQNTLAVYYLENGIRKNVDLQYSESVTGKGFYTSYFPSLATTTDRDFYLDLNNSIAYKIKVQLLTQNADCGAYRIESVSLNGMNCVVEDLDIPIYQLVL
jgi:hypothetical protein